MEFHTIATHLCPHLDEIVAIWLLKEYGRKYGGGKLATASDVKIVFWPSGPKAPDGRSPEEYEKEGILCVGVGGGRFDEHPNATAGRKTGECAATLVAKALGVSERPELQKILNNVSNNDLSGGAHPFELASLVKLMYAQYDDHIGVIEWAISGLEAKHREQEEFFSAKEEFERKVRIDRVVRPGRKPIVIATIHSDNEQMNKLARSEYGCSADLVIIQQSDGHAQIFCDRRAGINFDQVVMAVRNQEVLAKRFPHCSDGPRLAAEGIMPGTEEWYYFKSGNMLFNGSNTNRSVPPTRIPLETIRDLVLSTIR